jgi:hypothetical protein
MHSNMVALPVFFFFLVLVLEIKLRALYMVGKSSTTELYPSHLHIF